MAIFGCIADDFTGASDAASFLVKGGLPTQLFNGIPAAHVLPSREAQALVIALKTRTQDTKEAVHDSLEALKWLKKQGVSHFYVKYCSTFDSTPQGNIGPIADATLDFVGSRYTLLCPSLPVNGRIVSGGHLYVNGVPLHQSPMKDHPLTPMWDSYIPALMEPQSRYRCLTLEENCLSYPREAVESLLLSKADSLKLDRFYVIPDYQSDQDGERIAGLFGHLPLLTGGSGLLMPLAHRLCASSEQKIALPDSGADGPSLLMAGSCSKSTLGQIAYFQKHGGISVRMEPSQLLEHSVDETVEQIWDFIMSHSGKPVLVYSSDTAENVRLAQQKAGSTPISSLLEEACAQLAERAVHQGFRRLIIAGGETSGAVTRKLGLDSYQIGESVAPGIPVMVPPQLPELRLVLKSGNFGQEDFFERALEMTEKKQ